MKAKDEKFYSNPSQNLDFGKYSPPVPNGLIEKLTAIKLQTPKNPEQQQHNQSTPMQYQQTTSIIQDRITQFNGTSYRLTSAGINHSEETRTKQITPAKRQKMETENVLSSGSTQEDNTRVGSAQQASPEP
jgi:hypothetical protein